VSARQSDGGRNGGRNGDGDGGANGSGSADAGAAGGEAGRELRKSAEGAAAGNAQTAIRLDVPVLVDEHRCIRGCHICIDSCPVDCLSVNPVTGKAHMQFDECWYCLACELDCPKDAITVKIPFLLR
jgi:NAD-dependent dihydropyrimidine dehydrogenase PreA subunit